MDHAGDHAGMRIHVVSLRRCRGRLLGRAAHPVGAHIKFGLMRMSDTIFPRSICSNVPRRDMRMRRNAAAISQ
jgi:hypothetical protein